MTMATAVFFDRDGVLIEPRMLGEKPSSARTVEEVTFLADAAETVHALSEKGFLIFIVTNQPDIARGTLTADAVQAMNQKVVSGLGGKRLIKEVFVCPHDNQDQCNCRKPKPGMLEAAAAKWNLNLSASFLIGDREVDIQAARKAGCRAILIRAPYNEGIEADYQASGLKDAARWILENSR